MSITHTPLAEPLQDFIAADLANTSTGASTLLTPINYNADLFADHAAFLSGNYGFDGYMGVPGLSGTAPHGVIMPMWRTTILAVTLDVINHAATN